MSPASGAFTHASFRFLRLGHLVCLPLLIVLTGCGGGNGKETVVDRTPPTITITSPATGATLTSASVGISVTFSDDSSGINTTSFAAKLDGVDKTNSFSVTATGASYQGTLADGQHTVDVSVYDRTGNLGQASVSFTVDATPPTIAVTSPANGATLNNPSVAVAVSFSDSTSGVNTTTFAAKLDGADVTSSFAVTGEGASYQATLANGQHSIEASIKDKAGNTGQAASQFTVSAFRAVPDAFPRSGPTPLTVTFITRGECPFCQILRYRWDFQGDGIWDTDDPGANNYTRTFTKQGTYNAVLEVTNDRNEITTATVSIVVTGNPPVATASVNPSNGAAPLTVNFSGSGSDPDGTIAKYEWDFQGDGTFDFTSPTTGNTTYTYTSPGTYSALFRVTDDQGMTASAPESATTVRVGPAGSPTATITSPSSPQTRTAPATVFFSGTGTDPGGTITKYEWDFNADGVYDYSSATSASTSYTYNSPGVFTVAFRVTDNAGNTGVDTVDITINITATVTLSSDTLRPGGSVNINTALGGTTSVTVFIRNQAGQTIRTLIQDVVRNAGSYSDQWDGKDSDGNAVPEGVYYSILRYQAGGATRYVDLTNTTGNVLFNPSWDLATSAGGSCDDCTFAPYANNFLKSTLTMNQAGEVTVSIRGYYSEDEYAKLFDRQLFGRGTYTLYWDGANALGQLVHPSPSDGQFIWGVTAFTLPSNGIFVESAPQITDVTASPNYFDPATGNFLTPDKPKAKIQFTLTKSANVALQVFRVGATSPIRTIAASNLAAGQNTIEWDGKANNGIFVDKGDYRLALKAVDATGKQSIVRYLHMRVFY